jgi:mono/diheme cytochrome c family protein
MKNSASPRRPAFAILLCVFALSAAVFAGDAPRPAEPAGKKDATNAAAVVHSYDADAMRVQGEQRFRANCGRCHAAPQKFPPRMMATVLRHMRVRATITDQDMRLVLFYMTQ